MAGAQLELSGAVAIALDADRRPMVTAAPGCADPAGQPALGRDSAHTPEACGGYRLEETPA